MSLLRIVASVQNRLRYFSVINEQVKSVEVQEKVKETILQRWKKYWKNLYLDYKEVAIDVGKECKTRPIKSGIYFTGLGIGYYLVKTNPDLLTFREELLKNSMRLMFIGETTRNPVSINHVQHMEDCLNNNTIRRLNLGILSLIWLDNYSDNCKQYKVTCSYLKPQFITFDERIVDIGFLDKWWILERKMENYDVNDSEFS